MSQVAARDGIGISMTETSQTAQAVLLSGELRALREATGLNQSQFARKLGIGASAINKIERTKRHPRELVLRAWLANCGVTKGIEEFVRRAEKARNPDWWADASIVPTWFERYMRLEEASGWKKTYASALVPGLLQTRAYTEAIAVATRLPGPPGSAERLAEMRATRQRRLGDPSHPLYFTAVLDEAVIRRAVHGPAVMREQLAHLAEMAQRPNVTLHVLPFAAGAHPGMPGAFSMLQFTENTVNTVYMEHSHGATYVDNHKGVAYYEASFAHLVHLALGEAETITMIENIGREH